MDSVGFVFFNFLSNALNVVQDQSRQCSGVDGFFLTI